MLFRLLVVEPLSRELLGPVLVSGGVTGEGAPELGLSEAVVPVEGLFSEAVVPVEGLLSEVVVPVEGLFSEAVFSVEGLFSEEVVPVERLLSAALVLFSEL